MAKKKEQKTVTFSGGTLQIYSRWKCTLEVTRGQTLTSKYAMPLGQPTMEGGKVDISYSIPSGAKIKSSTVSATYISPFTGISALTLNGGLFKGSASVSLSGNSGTISCAFLFRANGNKVDLEQKLSTLTLKDITLTIKYEDDAPEDNGTQDDSQTTTNSLKFRVPPQAVCVYDQEEKKLYTFDGVMKIQQNMSLKIEEDPSKKKELYVNNARNEPDKVTIDVVMSDVYGDDIGGNLYLDSTSYDVSAAQSIGSGGGNTRSSRAVNLLHTLKEARRMLTVITPQFVYTDMLLQGVVVTQDDTCPFGWQGQLTFQEKYEETQKKDQTSSTKVSTDGTVSNSILADMWGTNVM